MGTFDSNDPGLGELTNDEDVVELNDLEFEPLGPPPASRSGENGAGGSDKLRKLLAKSRAVAANVVDEDYDELDDKTDMVSGLTFDVEDLPEPLEALAAASPVGAPSIGEAATADLPTAGPQFPVPDMGGSAQAPGGQGQHSGMGPGFVPYAPIPLAPSGEFGVVPDIGSQSRDDYPAYEAPSAGRRQSIAVGATVVVGVVAFFVIAKLIVDQWIAPGRAWVWMTAGTTLPTLLCGLLLAWPNRKGRASLRDVLVALVPALAVSGGAIFVATMWTQPAIRTLGVAYAPEAPSAMGAILEDPSLDVAVTGCKRFAAHHEETDYRALLFATLTVRPTLATRCMAELPEDAQLAIATSLADRWSRELAVDDEGADVGRLCATAGGLAALPLERASVGARLLRCTLASPSPAAQECCGQSLSAMAVDSKQFAMHLRQSMEYAKDDQTAAGVFAMAFHQKNLSEGQLKFAKEVNFTGPQAQLAALEFACNAVDAGRPSVIRYMRASLEGQCAVDPGGVPPSISAWREICAATLSELESDRTLPVSATMCSTTQLLSVAAAVDTAQRIVRLSRGKDLQGTFSKQIELGYIKVLQEMNPADVPAFVGEEDRLRVQAGELGTRDRGSANYGYKSPGDSEFDAFNKAYKANESWREARKKLRAKEAAKQKK